MHRVELIVYLVKIMQNEVYIFLRDLGGFSNMLVEVTVVQSLRGKIEEMAIRFVFSFLWNTTLEDVCL
jgi:hypothetical protein